MGFLRFAVTVVMAVTASTLVLAEPIIETWRSSFGECRSVAVDPEDGSVWVAAGASVVHLARGQSSHWAGDSAFLPLYR